jgi:four helix bundle protein
MFLQLNHKNLNAYKTSRQLLIQCYTITKYLPFEERNNLTTQIRRAALSVKLNIAEGSSRRSLPERKRFYEIARGSLIEIDAAIEAAIDLHFLTIDQAAILGGTINHLFALLTGLIRATIL